MAAASTKKKGKHGGKRPGAGPPRGRRLPRTTIERIRASINAKLAVDTLHDLCTNGGQHDGVRATAARTLLQYTVPAYAPVDTAGETVGPAVIVFENVDE
jgi:hypothetical protein